MDKELLEKTVARLVAKPKGILAIDESSPTCDARFEKLGIPKTEEKRREYRQLLITAPGIENYISGYILFDETIREEDTAGHSFVEILQAKGIEPGIKVDKGTKNFSADSVEKITEGIEGLDERLQEYKDLGATFAKWRAVYTISSETPSALVMKKNGELFAQYAKLCQKEGVVPIVEPEILINGNHTLEKCYEVTTRNLQVVFNELKLADVYIPGMILKTSMVLPGEDLKLQIDDSEIAKMTVKCLKENVPEDIGGIMFLSGGQPEEMATIRLNEMHKLGPLPWPLTFSYGREIQNPAIMHWAQNPNDVTTAQTILVSEAKNNSLASIGELKIEIFPPRREKGGEEQ